MMNRRAFLKMTLWNPLSRRPPPTASTVRSRPNFGVCRYAFAEVIGTDWIEKIMQPNQTGSVAVVVALIMTLLFSVMAFTMDVGYLYLEDNRYQNAVEAAALAGAQVLCEGDWEAVVRRMMEENGLARGDQALSVELGFYDDRDEYEENIGDLKDFGPPPAGRYENAVHVRLDRRVKSFSGMGREVQVVAEAVAYLQRIDMASLSENGVIRLGHNSTWENTIFFSNGDIAYPARATASGRVHQQPRFEGSELFATGEVLACPVEVESYGFSNADRMTIHWGSGSPQADDQFWPDSGLIDEIRPVDDIYLEYWRELADTVYTPDQAGQDSIYFGQGLGADGEVYYFVDPAAAPGDGHRIIFFDAKDQGTVLIGPASGNTLVAHTPNGNTLANLTFVATGPIRIQNLLPGSTDFTLRVGGEADDQALFVSGQDIKIFTSGVRYEGAVFRTGGDFVKDESQGASSRVQHIRVIADGDIHGEPYSLYVNDPGWFSFRNDGNFGPPCPPCMARLGRLEPVEK